MAHVRDGYPGMPETPPAWAVKVCPKPSTLLRSPYTPRCTPHTLHPTPCTLHPTPDTLHPTPYTLHPTPYTLQPRPYTLHPAPDTLHPALSNLHPTPYTLHPSPSSALIVDRLVIVQSSSSHQLASTMNGSENGVVVSGLGGVRPTLKARLSQAGYFLPLQGYLAYQKPPPRRTLQ